MALVSGFIQALAFDSSFDSAWRYLSPLASLLSLSLFIGTIAHLKPTKALVFSYLFGLGTFAWGLNWIYISLLDYGGASLVFAILSNIAVICYLALYWSAAGYLITRLGHTANQRFLLAAPVIALLEWLRSVFLIGFPWLSIGYAWVDTPLAHIASYGGVFLLSFMVLLWIAAVHLKLARRHKACILTALFIITLLLCIPHRVKPARDEVSVALLQGNMPVITEYSDNNMRKNIETYTELTDSVLQQSIPFDIIIWPEAAIPYFFVQVPDLRKNMLREQQQRHFDFISGSPRIDLTNQAVYNSIFLQRYSDQNIEQAQFYDKHHLLPFGEYLPFRRIFGFFKNYVDIPMSDFRSGPLTQPPFTTATITFAPSICFEAVDGDKIRRNALHAGALLNISNDAWFGHSKAQTQRVNIARLRAVENHKYLVRATNNGISAIINSKGKVVKTITPFTRGYLLAKIVPYHYITLYTRYGDKPWVFVFVLMIIVIILGRRGKPGKNRPT